MVKAECLMNNWKLVMRRVVTLVGIEIFTVNEKE